MAERDKSTATPRRWTLTTDLSEWRGPAIAVEGPEIGEGEEVQVVEVYREYHPKPIGKVLVGEDGAARELPYSPEVCTCQQTASAAPPCSVHGLKPSADYPRAYVCPGCGHSWCIERPEANEATCDCGGPGKPTAYPDWTHPGPNIEVPHTVRALRQKHGLPDPNWKIP